MSQPFAPPHRLALLERARVAAPCSEEWGRMIGDDRVRFCGVCQKNVYDLSALSRAEAESFVEAREGSLCVRFYRRDDGTMLTSDCPVGLRGRRRRQAVAGAVGGALMAAVTSALAGCEPAPTTAEPAASAPSKEAIVEASAARPGALPDAASEESMDLTRDDAGVAGDATMQADAGGRAACAPRDPKDAGAARRHAHVPAPDGRGPNRPTMGLLMMAE